MDNFYFLGNERKVSIKYEKYGTARNLLELKFLLKLARLIKNWIWQKQRGDDVLLFEDGISLETFNFKTTI